MALTVSFFNGNEGEWDNFILHKSMNGTFLQTRKFINYHTEGKFKDCSLCIRKGNELVGAILACEIDDGRKTFFAHKGSTYGGITLSKEVYNTTAVDKIMEALHGFLSENNFAKVYLKMVPQVYQNTNTDLIDYFLYKNGYICFDELNFYMHLDRYSMDVASQFTASKRRDYRYSLRNNLVFKKLEGYEEIAMFYDVLLRNLNKLGLPAVHTLEDLYDLKFNRFNEEIEFYGVYSEGKIMLAGSMVFLFGSNIFHTQYLASDEKYLDMYPMDFLITNLIQTAVDKGMDILTFGICTEDQGRYLNMGLSRFKEGFGAEYCINRSYMKLLDGNKIQSNFGM